MDMFKIIVLFLLPAVAYAEISIDVQVHNDTEKSKVLFQGEDVEIITDEDRKTFGITDDALKKAVGKLTGMEPTDVFVKSPTPWDDLYKKYNWDQVQRVLYPTGAKILGIKTVPEIFTSDRYRNDRNSSVVDAQSDELQIKTSIELADTASSTWKKSHEIAVKQKIKFNINFIVGGGEAETALSYTHSWGEEHTESKTLTVGSSLGATVPVKRGESAQVSISTSRGTMDIEIYYNAKLTGDVAINYASKYKDHHFWKYPIQEVMEAGGLTNGFNSTQIMKIGFYTKGDIIVTDGRKTLFTGPIVFS